MNDLGGERLSWWDLLCLIRWLPSGSAIGRQQNPDTWWRTTEVQIAAAAHDALQDANWQRARNPNSPRPEPLLPPLKAVVDKAPSTPKMSPTQIRDELARRRAAKAA